MLEPTPEQEDAIGLFMSGVNLAIEAGAGCLAGSTVLHVNRGGKGYRSDIATLADRFAGRFAAGVPWDPSIPTMVARADGETVRLGEVERVWFSGVQPAYEVRTVGGRVIRATGKHPFLTSHGWMHLADLEPGASVAVNAGRGARGRGRKPTYRSRATRCHPHQVRRSLTRDRWSVAEHRLVIEAEMNHMPLEEYLHVLRGDLLPDGILVLDRSLHVHHLDGDTVNNARRNLAVLTEAEHHRLHAESGEADNVLWQVGADTVHTVTPVGDEPTFDLSMRTAPHNFVADGFVVHNTGKTATLEMLARTTERSGAYVAFNRAIVNDAQQRMPMNVRSATAHALAMRQTGARYRHRLGAERVKSWQLARDLGTPAIDVTYNGGMRKRLAGSFLASLVMRGIIGFCQSADLVPTWQHIPPLKGIDDVLPGGGRATTNSDLVRHDLEPFLAKAWEDLRDPGGRLPFRHDHYLKMWALEDPVIPGEFVLFDEAQDASPVMLSAVERQGERGAQLVWVGDSAQQIYEWRGAVNALANLSAVERTCLSQSWRFGPAIAAAANVFLDAIDAPLRLTGSPNIESSLGFVAEPRCVLCRSNSGTIEVVVRESARRRRCAIVGGAEEAINFAVGVRDLKEKGTTWHPELACFSSWAEVVEYVEQDPQGDELALMVKLIEEWGLEIIISALDGTVSEESADVIVSTAHKAKGREWPTVRLHGDFPDADDRPEESRLAYVAVTRARGVLDVTACEPIRRRLADAGVA